MEFTSLTGAQTEELEARLELFDRAHTPEPREGHVSIGLLRDGKLLAGADGGMTAYDILYVSTVWVDKRFRGKGIGRALMEEVERRGRLLGARLLRLDTFNWQGRDFYRSLGYEEAGAYSDPQQGFSEHFFLKRL